MLAELLRELNQKNIFITVQDGKLKVKSPVALPEELKKRLRNNKQELIEFLEQKLALKEGGSVAESELNSKIPKSGRDAAVPMSYAQSQLWMLEKHQTETTKYGMPRAYFVHGEFDVTCFEQATANLLQRHEILRTVYQDINGFHEQRILHDYVLPFKLFDLTHQTQKEAVAHFRALAEIDAQKAFFLGQELPIRVQLFHLAEEEWGLLLNVHHIAADARAMELLLKELFTSYAKKLKGEALSKQHDGIQYADYAIWQQQQFHSTALQKELQYWKQQLADLPLVHGLKTDFSRDSNLKSIGASISQKLPIHTNKLIASFCKREDVTPFMVLQGVFALLIGRLSNTDDVAMGTTITGTNYKELESVLGMLVNVLVLRSRFQGEQSFKAFVHANRTMVLDAYEYQNAPFSLLVSELNPPRSPLFTPLFQIMISWPDKQRGNHRKMLSGLELIPLERKGFKPKNELELIVSEQDGQYSFRWDYNAELFDEATIEVVAIGFESLLKALLSASSQPMQDIPFELDGKLVAPKFDLSQLEGATLDQAGEVTETEEKLHHIWCEILAKDEIDRHMDFFNAGGNSLLAIMMISQIQEVLSKEIELKEIFAYDSIYRLSRFLDGQEQTVSDGIIAGDRPEIVPLSYAQQRLWFIDQVQQGSALYNIPNVLILEGDLDIAILQKALDSVLARHEVLRTTYPSNNGVPRQMIHADVQGMTGANIESMSLIHMPIEKAIEEFKYLRTKTSLTPFNLQEALPIRALVVALEAQVSALVLTLHHIASDGWSMSILVRELMALYEMYSKGEESQLTALPIQYADYALWQRSESNMQKWQSHLEYWRQNLEGISETHSLPLDRERPLQIQEMGATYKQFISPVLLQAIEALAAKEKLSLFMLLQSVFALLLARWSGESDIVMGTPVAGRGQSDIDPLIGFFVNTLVLRANLSGSPDFSDWLQQRKQQILAAFEHQDMPFDMLVEELRPERNMQHTPIFQIMFALNNVTAIQSTLFQSDFSQTNTQKLTVKGVNQYRPELRGHSSGKHKKDTAKFELTLDARVHSDGLHLSWNYADTLFDAATIECLAESFETLLQGVVSAPATSVWELPVIPANDADKLLQLQGRTKEYPDHLTIHETVTQQAAKTPDAIALIQGELTLTYRQMDCKANQLANYLLSQIADNPKRGSEETTYIGLCLPRGIDVLLGSLAVLKTGQAFVVLNPEYPAHRLQDIHDQCKMKWVISVQGMSDEWLPAGTELLCLDSQEFKQQIAQQPEVIPAAQELAVTPESMAYVVFTSGSTGQPKGVMTRHRGVVNMGLEKILAHEMGPGARVMQISSFSFDFSIAEWTMSLFHGATLVFASEEARYKPELFEQEVDSFGITHLNITPALLAELNPEKMPTLQHISVGGEPLEQVQADLWSSHFTLHNVYGPTECSAITHGALMTPGGEVTIGKPFQNVYCQVLDDRLRPVPSGVVGELCIGGICLSAGYMNMPDKTAEQFVQLESEFSANANVWYRTGDLVRYNQAGNLVFVGRKDHQVKIRGNRIELGEISQRLMDIEQVKHAFILVDGEGNSQRLLAYVATDSATAEYLSLKQKLVAHLRSELPDYMQPSVIMCLPVLPLNINGKVDTKQLPKAKETREELDTEHWSVMEGRLSKVWCEVLKMAQVGRDETFFELGGHSLLIAPMVNDIEQIFGVKVPIRTVFEQNTIRQLAGWLEAQNPSVVARIVPRSRNGLTTNDRDAVEYLPLSYSQQRLWFIHQVEPESSQYNIPYSLFLKGNVVVEKVQSAVNAIVSRHEILRTTYLYQKSAPVQVVHPEVSINVDYFDYSKLPLEQRREKLKQFRYQESRQPFALSDEYPIRVTLIKLQHDDSEAYALYVTMHHIASDGWSLGIFEKEFMRLYQNPEGKLPELPVQYADYAAWQREEASQTMLSEHEAYWREYLSGMPQLHHLPLDYERPEHLNFEGATFQHRFDSALAKQLNQLSQSADASLFMLLQSIFALLLARWSGETDIVIGTPVSGRDQAEIEPLIGFFVNTLVLRNQVQGNPIFLEYLSQSKAQMLTVFDHQTMPFDMLVETLNPPRSLQYMPLFQVMFLLHYQQNETQGRTLEGNGTSEHLMLTNLQDLGLQEGAGENRAHREDIAKFDLTLSVQVQEQGLLINWNYATHLFKPERIEQMAESFVTLVKAIVDNPDAGIRELPIVPYQQTRLLQQWQGQNHPFPDNLNIVQLIQKQVQKSPNEIAVQEGVHSLTYQELDLKSDAIASLISQKIKNQNASNQLTDTFPRVGLHLPRGINMMACVLGIMKAGAAYVPLDIYFPHNRIEHIQKTAQMSHIICLKNAEEKLQGLASDLLFIEDIEQQLSEQVGQKSNTELTAVTPDTIAYVIFTSGSTGLPKGVMVSHRSAVNLMTAPRVRLGIGPQTRMLQFASFNFDTSVWEWGTALAHGATLVFASDDARYDPQQLALEIEQNQISHALLPPALLPQLPKDKLSHMDCLVVAGEALEDHVASDWADKINLVNAYGPTECTVLATACRVKANEPVHIGYPLENIAVRILDEFGQPVPIGVSGELYLGGVGVAQGYLNQPDKTAQQFVELTTTDGGTESGKTWYKTGDLARFNADGSVFYLGRIDNQIKLRGYRIELNEIKHNMLQDERIKQAYVALRGEGNARYLAGYVTTDANASEYARIQQDILQRLTSELPEYMVPAGVICLAALPLNVSRKIDASALPEVHFTTAPDVDEELNSVQQYLRNLWQQVLQRENIRLDDSFFALGGHSLMVARVVNEVRDEFNLQIPIRKVFEHSSIRTLSGYIQSRLEQESPAYGDGKGTLAAIVPVNQEQYKPLSFAQQRLWFIEQYEPDTSRYNIPQAFELEGELNIGALQKALHHIVSRHEVLRTTYQLHDQTVVQTVEDIERFEILINDLSDMPKHTWISEQQKLLHQNARQPFDLLTDLPIRVTLVKVTPTQHLLLVNMHHIASDGWSIRVFINELNILYYDFLQEREVSLKPLPIQYADYAYWQQTQQAKQEQSLGLDYWLQRLADIPQVHALPLDFPRSEEVSAQGRTYRHSMPSDLLPALSALAQECNTSLFMLLNTAFALFLSRWSGEDDVVVGSPVAGRNRSEIEPLIGFFVNTLVLRTEFRGEPDFVTLMNQQRDLLLEDFEHQDTPFDLLVERIQPQRNRQHTPVYQVVFALHNAEQNRSVDTGLKINSINPLAISEKSTAEQRNHYSEEAKFELSVALQSNTDKQRLSMSWNYATDLFKPETVERMAASFETLLQGIVSAPKMCIWHLPIIPSAEQQILQQWQGSERAYPDQLTIHEMITQQALRTPDLTALIEGDRELSYAELDLQANQLANYLLAAHRVEAQGQQEVIGICLPRGIDMMISILAVLKTGAAFTHIDPLYPASRIKEIQSQSQMQSVITHAGLCEALQELQIAAVFLNEESVGVLIHQQPKQLKNIQYQPDNLAYVLFTSGSTGKPKGVVVRHGGIVNMATSPTVRNGAQPGSRKMQFFSFSFDASVVEWSTCLFHGATLIFFSEDAKYTPALFEQEVNYYQATHAFTSPTLLSELSPAHMPELQHLFVGGEALDQAQADRWSQHLVLHNAYGPTECSVVTSVVKIEPNKSVSIGHPIGNIYCQVLDKHQQPVPIGVKGELYLGGIGLAQCYLQQPQKTADAFVQLSSELSQNANRWYKTGDLVNYGSDGQLYISGRKDSQIKLRGYRIELGEIKDVLISHDDVKDATIILRGEGAEKKLLAYVTTDLKNGQYPKLHQALLRLMKSALPIYMFPSALTCLATFPRNRSDKIDESRLPEPDTLNHRAESDSQYTEMSPQVLRIARLFSELTKTPLTSITAESGFFDVGGNSLMAAVLAQKLTEAFEVELRVRDIFSHQTPTQLMALMQRKLHSGTNILPSDALRCEHQGEPKNTPIVLIHGVDGDTNAFRHLIDALHLKAPENPIYTLSSVGLAHDSLNKLAGFYLQNIRVKINQPVLLLGWSMGGIIAHAMLSLDEKSPSLIKQVVMLDSFADAIAEVSADKKADSALSASRKLLNFAWYLGCQDWRPGLHDETSTALKSLLSAGCSQGVFPKQMSLLQLQNIYRNFEFNWERLATHQLKVVDKPVLLLAAEKHLGRHDAGNSGWQEWVSQMQVQHVSDVDHFSMLSQSRVQQLVPTIMHLIQRDHAMENSSLETSKLLETDNAPNQTDHNKEQV